MAQGSNFLVILMTIPQQRCKITPSLLIKPPTPPFYRQDKECTGIIQLSARDMPIRGKMAQLYETFLNDVLKRNKHEKNREGTEAEGEGIFRVSLISRGESVLSQASRHRTFRTSWASFLLLLLLFLPFFSTRLPGTLWTWTQMMM